MIEEILNRTGPLVAFDYEAQLCETLLDCVYSTVLDNPENTGLALAAAFDLFVAAEYYISITHRKWLYCPKDRPLLLYTYLNTCPRCVIRGEFHYYKANKPPSGTIGKTTSKLLGIFYQALFKRHGRHLEVLRGSEPVDMFIVDREKRIVLMAEVKASPLITPPLAVMSDEMTQLIGDEIRAIPHSAVDNPTLNSSILHMFIGIKREEGLDYRLGELGQVSTERGWSYQRLAALIQREPTFFTDFYQFWLSAFRSYATLDRTSSTFWFTNACGQPFPRPVHWPRRGSGGGHESISDSKTSVGMDRTDDIKKGIYQVLKIGATTKVSDSDYQIKSALVSNIHAARHYDDYILPFEDVVWTISQSQNVRVIGDLPDDLNVYNLADGIVSFTQSHIKDVWIQELFHFHL